MALHCISVLLLLESSWRLAVRALFSDQCTRACVNDYLSARARGEYCSGFPGRRAEATARLEDKAHAAGSLIAARKECVGVALI